MTATATDIANTLRALAPDQKLFEAEVGLIDQIAALWAARMPQNGRDGAGASDTAGGAPKRSTGLKIAADFYANLRGSFGSLSQGQVDGIEALLAACGSAAWGISFTAYALATAWHETARTMQPIKEYGGAAYFHRMYDIEGQRPAKARELGNLNPGDGAAFCGRGYVQLTGRTNYGRAGAATGVNLLADPDAAMRPDVAAKVMIWGMAGGTFTGKKLADYLPASGVASTAAFTQARRIINGQDKAGEIAAHAARFQAALVAGGWA